MQRSLLLPLPQRQIVWSQEDEINHRRLPTGARPSGGSWRENNKICIKTIKHREGRRGWGPQRHTEGVILGPGAGKEKKMRVGCWLTFGEEQIFTKHSGLCSNNHVPYVPTPANQRSTVLHLSWSLV